jgi:hypothetical protein
MDHEPIMAGVSPGGFQDVYEVRILICYLLASVDSPLSKEQLNYIFQVNHLVNYFTFSNALSQLVKEGHITIKSEEKEEFCFLSKAGADTAKMLQNSLPRSVRDRVVSAALELLALQKKERENEVSIHKVSAGYVVKFVIHDTEFDLLRFQLFVPDRIQADYIKKNFLKDPSAFYGKIIQYLTKPELPEK